MTYFLIHTSLTILLEWANSIPLEGNKIFCIHCNPFEESKIKSESLNPKFFYLEARNKETLFRQLSEKISENINTTIIVDINLFSDNIINEKNYREYSAIKIINDLPRNIKEQINVFIYDDCLELSNIIVALTKNCKFFKKIEELFR